MRPANGKTVVLAINPKAGATDGGSRIAELASRLQAAGFLVAQESERKTAVERAMASHAEQRLAALVACGGDGTIADLVNRTPADLPLTALPMGTENLLARHFGLGPAPERVVAAIAGGKAIPLDCGLAAERLFLIMAGIGFDAEVVRQLDSQRTGRITKWHYLGPIWNATWNYKFPPLSIRYRSLSDGGSQWHETDARWLIAFNLPCYGGHFHMARDATGTQGQFELCLFQRGGIVSGLQLALAARLGRTDNLPGFVRCRATEFHVESTEPVPYQLDGDPGGYLPVDFRIVPGRMALLVPP